ncbi:hypothetical protein KFE25_009238 [Diacronema lutheri]|uniref:Uncharacterized protein n=1 Tax=Diacronema lutheri TaxID=2081491 RepID=A0A8J5XXZ4_DIALT|nr:hypothetical protein KFE25_009238 [Diacronema lutheri]
MGAMSTLRNMWYDDEDGWTYYEQSSKAKIDVDVFLSNATPNVPGTAHGRGKVRETRLQANYGQTKFIKP